MEYAAVAHPVERHLAKVEVASSSLVSRSMKRIFFGRSVFCFLKPKLLGELPAGRGQALRHHCGRTMESAPTNLRRLKSMHLRRGGGKLCAYGLPLRGRWHLLQQMTDEGIRGRFMNRPYEFAETKISAYP